MAEPGRTDGRAVDGGRTADAERDGEAAASARAPHPGYARSQMRSRVEGLKGRAREEADNVREKATERAAERTGEVARRAGARVNGAARAIRRTVGELRSEGDEDLASLAERLAGGAERLGRYLEEEPPSRMMRDARRMARNHPGAFIGGSLAAGLLLGRFLRADEPDEPDDDGVDVVFEPEGDWGLDRPGADGSGMAGSAESAGAAPRPLATSPGGPRERYPDETPVPTPIAGHETAGPGIRTGSSGAAALDAGSAGPGGPREPGGSTGGQTSDRSRRDRRGER